MVADICQRAIRRIWPWHCGSEVANNLPNWETTLNVRSISENQWRQDETLCFKGSKHLHNLQ